MKRPKRMRGQGFWYWWMRYDLEPLGHSDGAEDEIEFPPLPGVMVSPKKTM